jgi:predicted Zn-ribbon and HTH transcriptional regulator
MSKGEIMGLKVKIIKVKCKHCGYEWIPRKVSPTWCPKCIRTDLEIIEDKSSK